MANVLFNASQDLVPVDEGTLKASGRIVESGAGLAVTYGADDDGTAGHAPSNRYAVIIHEDLTLHHPNGGQAHFVLAPMYTERRAMLAAAVVSLRKALR